jgi:hypothetical protein
MDRRRSFGVVGIGISGEFSLPKFPSAFRNVSSETFDEAHAANAKAYGRVILGNGSPTRSACQPTVTLATRPPTQKPFLPFTNSGAHRRTTLIRSVMIVSWLPSRTTATCRCGKTRVHRNSSTITVRKRATMKRASDS